ncbi:MAG: pyridoxal phosphate-dependent aminotransferase [Nitrospiraceae bacterium]|nr:pyridoxal phosphate-dependent aminotransferase [Nitrospiraceae bacterium]
MLSSRAKEIKPSPTLAIDSKAKAMKAQGIDVISFGVGEPDFDTPENIKEAAIKAIKDGFTKYTAVGGTDKLKDAIIEKLEKDNGLKYERAEILVSCGAKHSLYNTMQALLDPGDEVIISSPYWVSYPEQVVLAGAKPVFVKTLEKDRFLLDPAAFEKGITGKTKALILNSPSNPTGFSYGREALGKIARIAVEKDIYVISDEIYEKLLYDGAEHVSIASLGEEIKKRTIVINGVSKAYSMTGWRIGYAAGPAALIKAMTSMQSQSTSNPASISQAAAVEALKGSQDSVKTMAAEFDKRRKFIVDGLNAIDGIKCIPPTGAFYAFPNTSALYGRSPEIGSSSKLAMYLLEKANVAVVPGDAFGDDDFIRLSYATGIGEIEKGLERIKKALAAF